MARRNSIPDELLEQFFEITGYIWQVGAVVTGIFLFLTYKSYFWISSTIESTLGKPIMAAMEQLSFILYLLPVSMLFLAVVFGLKTYSTYRGQNGI
ncbi:hypothetical protein KO495_15970 [Colwellia sp. D2M02]|uniref:hypothetical protein n=1 Tax=Colwellia sp. D2M02 TaxID=2841562 RepID=UPI001C08BE4A|nr:hypothetical protein [Colwellia sp. D2M02]MBU2894801.1 hypothetical protein [Colwellia sp. D2M02]